MKTENLESRHCVERDNPTQARYGPWRRVMWWVSPPKENRKAGFGHPGLSRPPRESSVVYLEAHRAFPCLACEQSAREGRGCVCGLAWEGLLSAEHRGNNGDGFGVDHGHSAGPRTYFVTVSSSVCCRTKSRRVLLSRYCRRTTTADWQHRTERMLLLTV